MPVVSTSGTCIEIRGVLVRRRSARTQATVADVTDMDLAPMAGDEELQYVRAQIRAMVRAGFSPYDQVLRAADEMLGSDSDASQRTAAVQAARDEWQARVREQEAWADEGSYTALAAAFTELERVGVVARMCFACCNTCGSTEIYDEADPNAADLLGYTFFHSQEADRLADAPGDLYLSFGGLDGVPAVAIGEIVAATVARHGFEVAWSGDAGAKVRVHVSNWRKRLPDEVQLAVSARLRVRPERGAPTLDPTPYDLLMLFHQVRRGRQQFFIVEDMTKEGRFVQTTCDGGPGFVVEHRDGSESAIHQAICPDLTLAHRVLSGWSTGDDGWRDLATWTRVDL
jgi:hypothetical protein